MSKVIIYGIPNCDTTKKAMAWLNKNNIAFTFHDYKQQGIAKQKLEDWCNKSGWENIFNKRSTTWRELSATERNKVTNQSAAVNVMMGNNSIIKRPMIENNSNLLIGFNEDEYIKVLKQ
jgi:arsenate reductase (glutaredoxin)